MIFEIIDNVFDEKTIDTLYGHFRDFSKWSFTGEGNKGTNWRKFYQDLVKNDKIHSILFKKSDEIFNDKLPHLKNTHFLDRPYASGYV